MIDTSRIKAAFSAKLKALLKERGMRQAELARRLSSTQVSVCRYVNGQRIPTVDVAVLIADALNVSMDELIRYDGATEDKADNPWTK